MRAAQNPLGSGQTRADHAGSRFEYAAKSRGIAGIEQAAARLRALHYEADVLGSMKELQLLDARIARLEHLHLPIEPTLLELAYEGSVTVGAEWMPVSEAVTSQALADHDSNLRAFGVQRFTVSLRFGQQDLRQR